MALLCLSFIGASQPQIADSASAEDQAEQSSREWSGISYRRSISLYKKAADEWSIEKNFAKSSACLRNAAQLHVILAEYDAADSLLSNALSLSRENRLTEEEMRVLSALSLSALNSGNIKKSKQLYRRALSLTRLVSDPDAIASAYYSAAEYNYSYGDIKETQRLLQKALQNAEPAGDKDLTAKIKLYLGFTFVRQGDPVSALRETTSALSIWRESGDQRGIAVGNLGVGFVYSFVDEKQKALEFYESARKAFPEDIDWTEKARANNGIATIYEEYGELGLAQNYRRDALKLYEKAGYLSGQLATLPSLADLSFRKGDLAEAFRLYDQGLALAAKLNDSFHVAVIKEGLGNLHLENGDFSRAIKNYREAIATYQAAKVKLPRVENLLGKAFERNGDAAQARHHYESALSANREIKDRFSEAQALYDLARLDARENKDEAALNNISESVALSESFSTNVLNSRLKSSYFSGIYKRYDLYIELLMKKAAATGNKEYETQALQAGEKSRARSMLETMRLSGSNIFRDANPDTVRRENEIRAMLDLKANMLTDALSANAPGSQVSHLSNEMDALHNELEEIKATLKRDSPLYSALKEPAPFDVAAFQDRVLDDRSVALVFSLGENAGYLWLIGKKEIESYALPPRQQIESRVEKLRELLTARDLEKDEASEAYSARMQKAEAEYWAEARLLSNELFGQLADKLTEKRLVVVPDGKLHYFPISALPFPGSPDNQPILLTNETVYEPSASTILLTVTHAPNQTAPSKDLLVFSDPVFSAQDPRLAGARPESGADTVVRSVTPERGPDAAKILPRLESSKTEGESIAGIVGRSNSKILSGFAANREQALNPQMSQYRMIHFATHGVIDENRPELSGIALSRFNESGLPQNEFVRLQDIFGLNLSADLIVLSACNTGMGKEVKGEGLISLTNGFMQVGARSVVSTLWKVDDAATVALMKDFYEKMAADNASPSEALRYAQIKMSQSQLYASPFYWGAFTIQGDFRTAPNAFLSRWPWAYILPFILLLFILLGYKLYKRWGHSAGQRTLKG